MAPKEAEKKRATTDAPVNAFDRNSDGSTSGLRLMRQWTTKSPIRITAAASTPTMVVVSHPQLLPSTSPNVSSPTPAVHRTTPSASGRSDSWPGRWGSERHPMIRAARPTGTLTRNTSRQLTATSNPPTTGPRAAASPPVAVQARTAPGRRSGS